MLHHLEHFHRIASRYQLGAAAILLWQMLYLCMTRSGSFKNFALSTSVFLDRLQISRQGLLQARKSLEDAGLLRTELGDDQHLRYTLCLDGDALQMERNTHSQPTIAEPMSDAAIAAIAEPLAMQPVQQVADGAVCDGVTEQHTQTMQAVAQGSAAVTPAGPIFADAAYRPGDIILNGKYTGYLSTVEHHLGKDVRYALQSWLKQRRDNGWTLTLWGLEELLQNLIRLAAGEAQRMVDIVKQSIRRRWKGFFALRVQSKPSGEKLLREERREQRNSRKSVGKPYATDDMDLSIFEE